MARYTETASGDLVRVPTPATKVTRRAEPLNTETTAGRASARDDQATRGAQVAGREAERAARSTDRHTVERLRAEVRSDVEQDARRRARRAERLRARAEAKQARALKNAAL